MPLQTNAYVFCADYSDMANCLFAIQATGDSGAFDGHTDILDLLGIFEQDVLKKLYNQTIWILGHLQGVSVTIDGQQAGDFERLDYSSTDFSVDFVDGEFEYWDFSGYDFNVGLIDERNSSYSSRFQTILNIFKLFCRYTPGLSSGDVQSLITTFIPVLDVFKQLREALAQAGLNPCSVSTDFSNNSLNLVLQAAGSPGTDGVPRGVHLRWLLTGDLGANHLPQGGYYNGLPDVIPTGYNKLDDYVTLSRTPYVNPVVTTLDFGTALPAIDYNTLTWTYVINVTYGSQKITNHIRVTFNDVSAYATISLDTDPTSDPFGFLKLYNGQLEISVDNKNAFSVAYDFRLNEGNSQAFLKIQAVSVFDTTGTASEVIGVQKTIMANSAEPVTGQFLGENIVRFRAQKSAEGYLQSISIETYADFANTRTIGDWVILGADFALSVTDEVVFDRLENSAYPIDDLWPLNTLGTRLKVANYQDQWLTPHEMGMPVKTGVQNYLEISQTDPRAVGQFTDPSMPDAPGIPVSYLDMMNMLMVDYHWARMMGMGHIDTSVNDLGAQQYVYQVTYVNRDGLNSQQNTTYQYLSLPTGLSDTRLPEKPVMRPVKYTLPADNGDRTIYDDNGYAVHGEERLVNIGRQLYPFEMAGSTFFNDLSQPSDFNNFDHPQSGTYGIEYRLNTVPNYAKPSITSTFLLSYPYYAYDADFPDTGVLEPVPVMDDQTSLYVHLETNDGIHAYAIYGINFLSRLSVLSDEVFTNDTEFPPHNTLTPPTGVGVQYIQQEDILLFTTQTEQDWLAGRAAQFPGQDTNFTRITFNRLDLIDLSYVRNIGGFDFSKVVKPTRSKVWFKTDQPLQVVGILTDIVPVGGSDTLLSLYTDDFVMLDGTSAAPFIASTDQARFIGSLLSTTEGQFPVVSISDNAGKPVFVVQKVAQTNAVDDPSNPGVYGAYQTYTYPAVGSRFTVTENLSEEGNWLPVAEDVQLIDFGDPMHPVLEITPGDGTNVRRLLVGGIYGSASVLQALDVDGNVMNGYYQITFTPDISLAPHPQNNLPFDPANPGANAPGTLHAPYVSWYNGQIRLPLADDPTTKKILDVIRISSTSPLQLYIYDGGYADDPVQTSVSSSDLLAGVNYHPGYKVYLYPEPPPDHAFNGPNILPSGAANDKKTMLALQETDLGPGRSGFVSWVSPPAVLLARKIVEPVQLPEPLNYGLKVRPDATTKAAFTFDNVILPDASGNARSPYGFMFYRTTAEDVLNALYLPATVTAIHQALSTLTVDNYATARYYELVNLIYDPANDGHFRVFDAQPAPYGFPVPDNTGPQTMTLPQKKASYQTAIHSTLLPLTAQPPVFSLLKTGLQTENKLPKLRDIDGNLLDINDPTFDPFPMVRKYTQSSVPSTSYVRVTDYTLNGSSRFLYFYGSAEITNQLIIGPLSLFTGPVTILHTLPADAPIVRFFNLGPPTTGSTSPVAVTFFLLPFDAEDPITKVRVYRTYTLDNAASLQTMETQTDIAVLTDTDTGIVTVDDFSDLPAVPYGEVIYYRLAFIRTIVNEREESEDVVGLGSAVVTVTLIDTVNPPPPALTYAAGSNELSWPVTANKGTYYLYQQNDRGNWQRIYGVTPPASATTVSYQLPAPLVLTGPDGNRIYYRFKVQAQNASGLLNLTDNELTI
ncbi:hypothetical protein BEL04_08305 [Mucilaginibacter sp. PPCGB 2223]|uniref:hypothetical protein n=1 Tax=Mucilaginibacter sp. PPCGB 2223 TaxID=1886027 RepID=UPI00082420D3|nr:hypothetical protein [Mucilaginibacter sp. PPCGB 2223]OCX54249.1 hypothetical protein BEL04_08305 [Mucilaginibacter sp. PPCGB 2223]